MSPNNYRLYRIKLFFQTHFGGNIIAAFRQWMELWEGRDGRGDRTWKLCWRRIGLRRNSSWARGEEEDKKTRHQESERMQEQVSTELETSTCHLRKSLQSLRLTPTGGSFYLWEKWEPEGAVVERPKRLRRRPSLHIAQLEEQKHENKERRTKEITAALKRLWIRKWGNSSCGRRRRSSRLSRGMRGHGKRHSAARRSREPDEWNVTEKKEEKMVLKSLMPDFNQALRSASTSTKWRWMEA